MTPRFPLPSIGRGPVSVGRAVGPAGNPDAPGGISSSLYSWYRPDGLPAGGSAISQWDDAYNSNHATQGTASAQPTSTAGLVNGFRGASFDGNDELVDGNTGATSLDGITLFVVIAPISADVSDNNLITAGDQQGSNFALALHDSTSNRVRFRLGAAQYGADVNYFDGNPHIITAIADRLNDRGLIRFDGTTVVDDSSQIPSVSFDEDLRIGAASDGGFFTESLMEAGFYTENHVGSLGNIESYLNDKYEVF